MLSPELPDSSRKTPRNKTKWNSPLEKRLAAYAAGAAGMAMLASVPPAEAEIVYTPVSVTIPPSYQLDLNNDGIVDFEIYLYPVNHADLLQVALKVQGNAVKANKRGGEAGALFHGAPIGAKQAFVSTNGTYGGIFMAAAGEYSRSYSFGPWKQTINRYLGLKFLINNEVHYGWARLTVQAQFEGRGTVTLTGYAYETVPNKAIRAGETSEGLGEETNLQPLPEVAPSPATLGLLARGAEGLAIWRRDGGS